ncbi:hypothetical protein [Negadavirga shengliensis]|uniref:Uncharacterized protein n=1 Tax=Negadavirga shengliensis TaxID=1389218 RepID=A0ABV9SUP9_9BACT
MKFKDIRLWLFVFGFVFLIAAYLYQHSRTNQQQLEDQAVKAVSLAKGSFLDAFYSYHDQLDSYLKRNFYKWNSTDDPLSPAAALVALLDKEKRFEVNRMRMVPEDREKRLPFENVKINLIRRDSAFYLHVEDYRFVFEERTAEGSYPTPDISMLYRNLSDRMQVGIEGAGRDSRTFEVSHSVSLSTLMKHNLQSLFFDELYLLDDEGTILYPSKSAGLNLLKPDQLDSIEAKTTGNPVFGERKLKLYLSGEEYEGFISPFFLGDKKLMLVGVKESLQFQKVAYRINFNLLNLFLTGLLLIFVSIPIISIFNLSEGDILTKKRVFGLGLSLIVLMVVLGFFSFSLIRHYPLVTADNEEMNDLTAAFSAETSAHIKRLQAYDVHGKGTLGDSGTSYEHVNELLTFDAEGRILSMVIPNSERKTSPVRFEENPFISIASRDYVKQLPDSENEYFISAHYSRATGELEGVISGRFGDMGRAITFRLDRIASQLSGKYRYFIFRADGKVLLKSEKVNIPVNYLQEGIGEDKWQEILTLIKNNYNARADASWRTPLYFNGYEYEALLKRLDSDRLGGDNWLLFLEDKNLQHTLHTLASLEALTVFIPYLLVLILLSLFTMMAKKSSIYLAFAQFSFYWYSPSPQKRGRYLWLNYILAADILIYILMYLFMPLCIFKIYLWAGVFAIQAGTCNFILLHYKGAGQFKGSKINFVIPAVALWTAFAVALLYLSYVSLSLGYFLWTVVILVVIAGLLALCFGLARKNRMPSLLPTDFDKTGFLKRWHAKLTRWWNLVTLVQVDKRIYALNFLLWLVIIGFLPGYFIHRQIFEQERFIWENVESYTAEKPQAPEGGYGELIKAYEKLRRINFAKIATREDRQISKFIAPSEHLLQASFYLPSNMDRKSKSGGTEQKGNKMAWLILILLMVLLFIMIMRLGNKIYLIDYLFTVHEPELPASAKGQLYNFIIGLDSRKSREWVMQQFGYGPNEVLLIDVGGKDRGLPRRLPVHKAVILENIHCILDTAEFAAFLKNFRKQYFNKGLGVFVISGKPFQELMPPSLTAGERMVLSEMFSGFLFHFVPLHYANPLIALPYPDKNWENMDRLDRERYTRRIQSTLFNDEKVHELCEEIAHGPNGASLAALITVELMQDSEENPLSQERFEKCILSIQRYNKAYYMNIWGELNMKEKKMVYNFAKEGFINFANKETMTALLQKGVFVLNSHRDGLVLFSRSFRNYAYMNATPEELSRFKQDERKTGNAKMIQMAAFSFVFISIAVISYYDPNILNQTSAYVSAVIGVAGTVYSFFAKGFGKNIDHANH